MILGADVRDDRIAIRGWQDSSPLGIDDLVTRFQPLGLKECIATEISRDGTLLGPASAMYIRLRREFPDVSFTISGGISSMNDIRALDALKLQKVIVGKALYEQKITLEQLRVCLQNESFPASM